MRRETGESVMKPSEKTIGSLGYLLAAVCFLGIGIVQIIPARASADLLLYDLGGESLYKQYDITPDSYLSAGSGDRNLNGFYDLRQYPGSPPRIPHPAEDSFSGKTQNCLSCHARGGYSPEYQKFIPVTPHPDKELCYQCHVPLKEVKRRFQENNWESINPPRLGRSALGGSPPMIPHSLQLRENCIACHTGPGAVVEIRIGHAARGNCRQCHVPMVQTEPVRVFSRTR
jgi:nitrate reductase (cytochrome), electron transfer subunit